MTPEGTMIGKDLAIRIAQAALDKKAEDLQVFDLRGLTSYTDFIVICSGTSDRQVQAIAEGIEVDLKTENARVLGTEGYEEGQWILLDYGDVIVHVFFQHVRDFYDLEGLWSDAPRLSVSGATSASAQA
jgi:ribosome-associated protein